MIELPLLFVGGLLGSAHCVGMCGGFALMIGGARRRLVQNLLRQGVYSCGRIFTYAILGGAVGTGGLALSARLSGVVDAQAVLALCAGALLVIQGLISAGVWAWAVKSWRAPPANRQLPILAGASEGSGVGCLMGGMVGEYLRRPGPGGAFLAGVLTGLLPCGLVYGYLTYAAATSSLWAGALCMVAFGLGTAPLMILTGLGGNIVSLSSRRRLLQAAAWVVVLTGAVSIARGVSAMQKTTSDPSQRTSAASCPWCD